MTTVLAASSILDSSPYDSEPESGQEIFYVTGTLRAGTFQIWEQAFRQGELTSLSARVDGLVELFLYDGHGHFLGRTKDDYGLYVPFVPRQSGLHFILLTNEARRQVEYTLTAG